MQPCFRSVLLACSLLAATANAAGLSDAGVAKAMKPPFYSGAILPTPKEAQYADTSVVLLDGPQARTRVTWTLSADEGLAELLRRLIDLRFAPYRNQFTGKEWHDSEAPVPAIFVKAPELDSAGPSIAPKVLARLDGLPEQGYILSITPQAIVGVGKDNAGVVNALASFLQLLHVRDGALAAGCANIVDWPTFTIRYTSEYRILGPDYFDWMMLYKINGFATSYRVFDWRAITDEQREPLETLGRFIERHGTMFYQAQLHLSGRARGDAVMDSRNPEHREQLFETIRMLLEVGKARHLWICYDDTRPELQPMEAAAGFTSPAEAHAALLEEIHAFATAVRPDVTVGWVPVPYQGRGHRRWRNDSKYRDYDIAYLEAIRKWPFTKVPIVWTGPVTESRSITLEDLEDYYERIGAGKRLSYWDNTWHYHQPLRNFHAKYLDGFVEHCAEATSFINVNCATPIGRFFTVTANDYYWNPESFDSKRCRKQAVAQFMGPEAVEPAERFYDLRGEDYWVFFAAKVDLEAFANVLHDLEAASWDATIPQSSWSSLDAAAKAQGKPSPRENK